MPLLKYLVQYRFSHMVELVRNSKKSPRTCAEDLKGKTVVITGATAGIGFETAKLFACKGARLICINRNANKSVDLEKLLKKEYSCDIKTIVADFSSLSQVKECAEELLSMKEPIDVLIHNAGVFNTKKQLSEDGIEMVFQVNHLAAFYLNFILKERLRQENRARIIYVNSEGHRFALAGVHTNDLDWKYHLYTGLKSYGSAKTAQLLTMKRFNDFFSDCSVTINAMHPGNVRSDMGNNNGKIYRWLKKKLILSSALDPLISAQALLYFAASEELKKDSGNFYHLTTKENPAPHARDFSRIDEVWQKSLELCGLVNRASEKSFIREVSTEERL